MNISGLIFDFDGVLLESEYAGNLQVADYLTGIGHPTTVEDSMNHFMGLSGSGFIAAVEGWIGRPLPDEFHAARFEEDERVMAEGLDAVAGAVDFIRSLPSSFPKSIASSSRSRWIETHLDHLGLREIFDGMIFSGHEHVVRGKPAPDIYLHAAAAMGVTIDQCAIIEDSPVGVTGALASGAHVIGLCAGRHCLAGHEARLRGLGVGTIAHSFEDVAALLELKETAS